jgi:16S rRNA (guanine966-N2)-methyltransferase
MSKAKRHSNALRIIAGEWRSRIVKFPEAEGLRPTPDRVRETLFNWLTPFIPGARCLDLFAGSGALGWEAASRGAAEVVFVDKQRAVTDALRAQQALFNASHARIVETDSMVFLQRDPSPFDIVFLDPPYASGLLAKASDLLERMGWLKVMAHIYVEADRATGLPELPTRWEIIKSGNAGQVEYHLIRHHGA